MLDKFMNFILDYAVKLNVIEQYLHIIDKTRLLYNRKYTHSIYLNLANYTLDELREVYNG